MSQRDTNTTTRAEMSAPEAAAAQAEPIEPQFDEMGASTEAQLAAEARAAEAASDAKPYEWHDPKRHLWLLGMLPAGILFPALGLFAGLNALANHDVLGIEVLWRVAALASLFAAPVLVFVVIPVIDYLAGRDGSNPPEEMRERLEADTFYRWVIYTYVPLQYATLIMACYLWSADDLSWLGNAGPLPFVGKLGVMLAAGVAGGIGINTAHELGHKIESVEQWASKITLATTGYGHFYVEHNRGHHARVATPEDPASSRFGESFWRFLPRTVFGSLKSAWNLEADRLRRTGRSPYTLRNDNISAWAMTVVLFGALTAIFGWVVLPWLVVQAIYGFSLLEVVNYLEHYGLRRQKTDKGRYQRCRAEHSWNSDHMVTNIFLFHLQRHSDHHANPMRRYQVLRTVDEAPQLPAGYAAMIVIAYVPWLWRRIMDHRVLDHYDGDITRANIAPHRREAILARYAAPADRTPLDDAAAHAPVALLEDVDAAAGLGAGISASGTYVCPNCGHHYIESRGEPRDGYAPGTPWSELPDDWQCPDCGVREKIDYLPVD